VHLVPRLLLDGVAKLVQQQGERRVDHDHVVLAAVPGGAAERLVERQPVLARLGHNLERGQVGER